MYVGRYVCRYVGMYVCMYVYMYEYIYIYIYMYMYMYMYMFMFIYVCTRTGDRTKAPRCVAPTSRQNNGSMGLKRLSVIKRVFSGTQGRGLRETECVMSGLWLYEGPKALTVDDINPALP